MLLRDYVMYSDCPSTRGQKHIREISDYMKRSRKGILLFIAALAQVKALKPNKQADTKLHELLLRANKIGVMAKSIDLYYNPEDSFVYLFNPDLRIDLSQI